MLSSLQGLKEEVNEALKRTGNYDLCIKKNEWNVLSQLIKVLQSIELLTDIASGNFVTLSAIPLIRAKLFSTCAPSDIDCPEISELKQKILLKIDKRFPINDFILIAALLDPASKNKKYLGITQKMKRDILIKALTEADNGSVMSGSTISTPVLTGISSIHSAGTSSESADPLPKRLRVMDEFEDEDTGGDIIALVSQYVSVNERPEKDERADPFLYWKNSKNKHLASLAKMYLTVSVSSVPVESMFSVCGLLLNGRRSSLAPHNFNKLIVLHDNAKLYTHACEM